MMRQDKKVRIGAVVLAAGMSTRMGVPKMTLPWRGSTVLGAVLAALAQAGVLQIRVVTGANQPEVERIIDETQIQVERVFNPLFTNGEMIDSIRVGLVGFEARVDAALIVLGDQPQLEASVVTGLVARYAETGSRLIVPSYQMRRGHPWLVDRSLWQELIDAEEGVTMRAFLNRHAAEIDYFAVNTDSVMKDLDTPEDYRKETAEK